MVQILSELLKRGPFKSIKIFENELLLQSLSVPSGFEKFTCPSVTFK